MELVNLLRRKGLLKQFTKIPTGFSSRAVYCGFDATGESLHLGHLPGLIGLVAAGGTGMRPIGLIGTATAMVGDPAGHTSTRKLLGKTEVALHASSIKEQLNRIYGNLAERAVKAGFIANAMDLLLLENHEFYRGLDLVGFLREVGSYFPMNPLMSRDIVINREESMTFAEFSYCLMQAYDFYQLYLEYECGMQIGGSDQWSNIITGTELIRKKAGGDSVGVTIPLLTTRNGEKLGKTSGNAVLFSSSAYDMYQFLYNLPDETAEELLKKLTFLREDIQRSSERTLQKALSREILCATHTEASYLQATRISELLFNSEYTELTETDIAALGQYTPHFHLPSSAKDMDILQLLKGRITSSNKESRQLISTSSLHINNTKVTLASTLSGVPPLASCHYIFRKGKKQLFLLSLSNK